ncbi:MAG TPA: SLBB domain-containing protein [Gemmatimonadaceae bacterium]|nr:SLBB domain-containing protein [Gemmatimonadaceae bacterium]
MNSNRLRSLVCSAIFLLTPALVAAQNPTDAQRMLENNPALLQQLRQRILSSGLSPDQVRARLRAEGYPENLLDQYLPGANTGGENVNPGGTTPDDVFNAISRLGIVDTLEAETLKCASMPLDDTTLSVADTSRQAISTRTRAIQRARCQARLDSLNRVLSPGDSARLKAQQDSGFQIFGLSMFRTISTLFDPNLNGPVDENYRLGPGDQLVLILTGDVSQSYTLDVTREGFIVVPQAGQIYVNGITLGQLQDILYTRLGRVYSGVRRGPGATTRFSISPARLRSNQIFVVGDVVDPGSYRISSAGTALTALYAARGPSDNGSLRNIQIKRNGKTVDVLDVYDYLIGGDASHDVRLNTGDVVFVPVHLNHVRVVGQVIRPATYEMRKDETLADAIRFAGGFAPTAARSRVQIERILPPNQRGEGGRDRYTIDVSSAALASEATGPAIPLQPGDVIRVFKITDRIRNRITIAGNVWQPGSFGLTPGMTVAQALHAAGGVKPDTYLGQLLISRLNSDSTRVQLHASLADTTGRVIGDLPLREDDEIRVFSVSEFRPTRYVAITGAVQNSGQVPYHEGMTVRDLILQAGGLQQSADLREAEIARLPANRANGATAVTSRVPLDSSYIFERGPDGKYFGPPGLPAASGSMPEVFLRPYDNVLIFRQPNWELQRTAVVSGEVMRPGSYSLTTKTEKISDLIKRAGGLTPEAYADGVTFFRANDKVGRIGIALPEILRNPGSRDNLQLQDGDSIFIPRYNAVVNVKGAVNSPVAVTYVPGRSLEYYVRAAGGITRRGDLRYAYVTQPNGKVEATSGKFIFKTNPHPRPGSTVYVPEKDPNDHPTPFLQTVGTLAQAAAAVLTLAIALKR